MGCGANLKVTAISTPSGKKDPQPEAQERRWHIPRFKLPTEVLSGFENVLKVVTRKTIGKRRKPNHLTDVPAPAGPSAVSDGATLKEMQHEEKTMKRQMSVLGSSSGKEAASPVELEKPLAANSKQSGSWVSDARDSIVNSSKTPLHDDSLFQHVSEQPADISKTIKDTDYEEGKSSAKPVQEEEAELLSPDAPGMLSEDEEQAYDNETRRAARLELERSAQVEATRMAARKRSEEEKELEEQQDAISRMEGEAASIMSKYG